jgi:putative phosphoribosyl transferase
MKAALRATRARNPKKLVLAVPVAPTKFFGAIGDYYGDFTQVSDDEVIDTLKRFSGQRVKETKEPAA